MVLLQYNTLAMGNLQQGGLHLYHKINLAEHVILILKNMRSLTRCVKILPPTSCK